jgi:hypothetical protein
MECKWFGIDTIYICALKIDSRIIFFIAIYHDWQLCGIYHTPINMNLLHENNIRSDTIRGEGKVCLQHMS